MDKKEKKLIIRFAQAERLKSSIINTMQVVLRFQDFFEHKKDEPDGRTVFIWGLNQLFNDIARAVNISGGKNLVEAQNLLGMVISQMEISGQQPNFQQIMDNLRKAITQITSEAANAADELNFG